MHPWRATIWTITLVLVAAVAYSAAVTTTLLIEQRLNVTHKERPARQGAVNRGSVEGDARERRPLSDYRAILDRDIFEARRSQERVAKAQPAQGREPPAPFTVTVTGTLLAGDESFAMVIGQKGSAEQVYKAGECLPQEDSNRTSKCAPDQAKLLRIEMDRIVVSQRGKQIPIAVTTGPASRVAARPADRVTRPGAAERTPGKPLTALERRRERLAVRKGAPDREPPVRANKRGKEEDDGETEAEPAAGNTFPSQHDGNTYRFTVPNSEVEKAFENFSEVAGQAAAVPIIENGQPKGFQLRKIHPGSIYQRLGLKDNDLVLSVNGESLTTADQALRLFTVFRNEREITLDIRRGKQDLHMNYSVE
jgi:type II secretory pathway component PulC